MLGKTKPASIRGNPETKTDKNLGGVPGELGNRSTVTVTDPGPLSRNGYYHLDDNRSALFDKATEWCEAQAGEE